MSYKTIKATSDWALENEPMAILMTKEGWESIKERFGMQGSPEYDQGVLAFPEDIVATTPFVEMKMEIVEGEE